MEKKTKTTKKETKVSDNNELSLVIRIDGMVNVKPKITNTLDRLRLRRKYAAILVNLNKKDIAGMIKEVRYSVSYGNISKETLVRLLKARGQKIDKKSFNEEEIADKLISGMSLEELGFKPFFRLHPPRKGINSKLQYPEGVLGNNKKINELVERML